MLKLLDKPLPPFVVLDKRLLLQMQLHKLSMVEMLCLLLRLLLRHWHQPMEMLLWLMLLQQQLLKPVVLETLLQRQLLKLLWKLLKVVILLLQPRLFRKLQLLPLVGMHLFQLLLLLLLLQKELAKRLHKLLPKPLPAETLVLLKLQQQRKLKPHVLEVVPLLLL